MFDTIGIAICDDESYYRELIKKLVEENMNKEDVSYTLDVFSSGRQLIDNCDNFQKYDLIFLDIGMEIIDGMCTAQEIRKNNSEVDIVFVTVMMNHVFDGYKVNAYRYILKDELKEGIAECMSAIMEKWKLNYPYIDLPFIGGNQKVFCDQIIFIESQLHKLCFSLWKTDEKLYLYKKLDVIEEMIGIYGFVRIHKSYLVNMAYISKISGYKVYLQNGSELIVPKSRYQDVKEKFLRFKELM